MMWEVLRLVVVLCLVAGAACAQDGWRPRTAGILLSGLPGEDTALASDLSLTVKKAGYNAETIGFDTICDPGRLTTESYDLLVLPDSASLPARAAKSVDDYLRSGGDLIALNAPMWQRVLFDVSGEWMTREEYLAKPRPLADSRVVIDFHPETMSAWQLSNSHPVPGLVHESIEQGPAPGLRALHVKVPKLIGWDAYQLWEVKEPFRAGANLTVFRARGGPHTAQMGIEWGEKDGSRWIAVVSLTQEWKEYILAPQDFRYHPSNPSRGFAGDMLKPGNAKSFNVQVAIGVTDYYGDEEQEFWIGPVATASPSPELEELLKPVTLPPLDTLCPAYHLFDCTGVERIKDIRFGTAGFDEACPAVTIRAPYSRPSGAGFEKGRTWRCLPLMEAFTADGEWRGNPASLMVHAAGDYKGGAWASFGVHGHDWYRTAPAMELIRRAAAAMSEGLFIIDGGSHFYTYFEDQQMKLGVRAVNLSDSARQVTLRVTVSHADAAKTAFTWDRPLHLAAGAVRSVSTYWQPREWPDQGYVVTAELLLEGRIIDSVSHRAYVWKPKARPCYVTVKNGRVMLDGRIWKPHGVNYMPSSGQAHEDYTFFNSWLGGRSYDPAIVQRDLEKVRELGFNSVSVFLLRSVAEHQNLPDFLRRCELLGLKVNLFLGPSAPRDYRFEPVKEMIERLRLKDNDTVFAYDLDWEPVWGTHEDRAKWDREWERWIVERYGSIESAEKDWGFAVPRDASGSVTNPLPDHIDTDGDWRRMVAAYRRFLDTLVYKRYSAAARMVKSIDPNHLISFRMSDGGSPTFSWGGRMVYDFPYLGAALDFLSPEAYGRVGDWERTKPGWFEREYARWAAPHLPMIWAEAGFSTWDPQKSAATPKRLEFQAKVYRNFYELMVKSGADGIYWWFYPGGFRFEEKSDYGVVNADGSDRPATRVIREYARRYIAAPPPRDVTDWITIDRDKRADGLFGVHEDVKGEFWELIEAGRVPGIRTEGTGTTSANCPLVAVGNTPCNGSNPPKYLDAAFDSVEVLDADGKWTPVEDGGSVKIDPGKRVVARLRLTNLGEAKWITSGEGAVCIISEGPETIRTPLPTMVQQAGSVLVRNVTLANPGITGTAQITITLSAEGRTRFGEKYKVTAVPLP